jgi:Arc/MetJ-type ribon-helix-helix transcriptional regulator
MIIHHTGDQTMASVKVAITLEQETLRQVDSLVARRVFQNRSRAIQTALHEKAAASTLNAQSWTQNSSSCWRKRARESMRLYGQNSKR